MKIKSKAQAKRLYQRLCRQFPELPGEAIMAKMQPRQTKRERELDEARQEAYAHGEQRALARSRAELAQADTEFKNKRRELHLETLRAVRDLASAYGQMMGEVGRAMMSEKDQL